MELNGKVKSRRRRTMDAKEMGRLGGRARAAKLTPEERRKIALKGAKASKAARKKRAKEKAEAQKTNPTQPPREE